MHEYRVWGLGFRGIKIKNKKPLNIHMYRKESGVRGLEARGQTTRYDCVRNYQK